MVHNPQTLERYCALYEDLFKLYYQNKYDGLDEQVTTSSDDETSSHHWYSPLKRHCRRSRKLSIFSFSRTLVSCSIKKWDVPHRYVDLKVVHNILTVSVFYDFN